MTLATHLAPTHAPSAVLLADRRDGVLTLTMNRPLQRNALSRDLMSAIQAALAEAAGDAATRVVVLRGAGPAFCSGHDLKEMSQFRSDPDKGAARFAALFQQCSEMMQAIVALPKPVIAQVHGVATAAGCQLVATCDLAIADEGAMFATPGVNIGLFCSTPLVALTRNLAPKNAMEMLLTGDMVTARDAMAMGLVNRVVPADELADAVQALATRIASKSQLTISVGKRVFYGQQGLALPDAYRLAAEAMTRNMMAQDAIEGIGAFLEKRPPHWTDR